MTVPFFGAMLSTDLQDIFFLIFMLKLTV